MLVYASSKSPAFLCHRHAALHASLTQYSTHFRRETQTLEPQHPLPNLHASIAEHAHALVQIFATQFAFQKIRTRHTSVSDALELEDGRVDIQRLGCFPISSKLLLERFPPGMIRNRLSTS